MIEKIIHVFNKKKKENLELFNKIKKHNIELLSDYEFIYWNKKKIQKFVEKNGLPNDKKRLRIVCKLGGFFVNSNYYFLKNIDVFLEHEFMSVFDSSNKLKFFGTKKDNNIINEIILKNKKFEDRFLYGHPQNKLVNPIYFYPQLKTNQYIVIEVNRDYYFGYNVKDSPWVLEKKLTGMSSGFRFNTQEYHFNRNKIVVKDTSKKDNLVVVAHPDDDMLFFGEFLLENGNDTKVLCVTNSSNDRRRNEFISVMEEIGCDYEMWDLFNIKSYALYEPFRERLREYVKNYDKVYTHALSGETGHPTHILISKYLFDVVEKNLYVANPFRQKYILEDRKINLLEKYVSQDGIWKMYRNISGREDFLRIK